MKNKFSWNNDELPTVIKNSDLQCKNCTHRLKDDKISAKCKMYHVKPVKVLTKTGNCNLYEVSNTN